MLSGGGVGVCQKLLSPKRIGMVRTHLRPEALEGLLQERDGRVTLARAKVTLRQIGSTYERIGVVGIELRLPQLEGCLEQRDGLGSAAGGEVGQAQALATGERIGVVGIELQLHQLMVPLE